MTVEEKVCVFEAEQSFIIFCVILKINVENNGEINRIKMYLWQIYEYLLSSYPKSYLQSKEL